MNCAECRARRDAENVPFVAHESAMARAERTQKRLWITVLLLIVLLVGTNLAWIYYESQFEVVETTYEASTDGGGTAIANGEGSVTYYGDGESDHQEAHP